ncbi:MAG: aldo/keto reductase [Thermoplasmata archaeon]
MNYKRFYDMKISIIGQGTWQGSMKGWGNDYSENEYIKGIEKSIDLGVNFFDTAEIYGNGYSERLLGKALSGYDRESFVIATKIAPFNIKKWEKHLERSLMNLNMKYVDIYQLHWPTPLYVNLKKYIEQMGKAVDDGKIRYIGVSNFYIKDLEKIDFKIISDQIKYNILKKQLNDDEIKMLLEKKKIVIGYSPLEMGVLSGKYSHDKKPSGYLRKNLPYFRKDNFENFRELMDFLNQLSERYGNSISQISLKYIIMKDVIPIYGSKNPRQSEENALSFNASLKMEDVKKIDDLVKNLNIKNFSDDWSKLIRNMPLLLQKIVLKSFI